MKEYNQETEKQVYEQVKQIFAYLGLDKKMDEATFKKLSGKYKTYFLEEALSWK